MRMSDQINELAGAMAKAQAVIKNPLKDRTNPHFKSTYADIAAGLDCIRPALSSCGLSFWQITEVVEDGVVLHTMIAHAGSGQWIAGTYPVSKLAPHQQMAGALTYAKRQALFALAGVHGEEDDDDGATANTAPVAGARPAPRSLAPTARERPAPEREEAPVEALSAKDSATTRAAMLMSLEYCNDREALHEWAKLNRATKQRLTQDDQRLIVDAYTAKQAAIQTISQAAE